MLFICGSPRFRFVVIPVRGFFVYLGMKEIVVNSKKHGVKTILIDDADFEIIKHMNWYVYKHRNTFYAATNIKLESGKRTKITMHRIIIKTKLECDHIDHNGLNNQRSNLRTATRSQNGSNTTTWKNGTSKYLGVCLPNGKKKYMAQIKKKGVRVHLGNFENEIEAALAYNKAAKEIHGEFANLNIIPTY